MCLWLNPGLALCSEVTSSKAFVILGIEPESAHSRQLPLWTQNFHLAIRLIDLFHILELHFLGVSSISWTTANLILEIGPFRFGNLSDSFYVMLLYNLNY